MPRATAGLNALRLEVAVLGKLAVPALLRAVVHVLRARGAVRDADVHAPEARRVRLAVLRRATRAAAHATPPSPSTTAFFGAAKAATAAVMVATAMPTHSFVFT